MLGSWVVAADNAPLNAEKGIRGRKATAGVGHKYAAGKRQLHAVTGRPIQWLDPTAIERADPTRGSAGLFVARTLQQSYSRDLF